MTAIAEAAAQYHAQGLPCPWDCARCDPPYVVVAEALLDLACGHTEREVLHEGEATSCYPGGRYCWTCHTVAPVTRTVVLLPVPFVPRRPAEPATDPWAGIENPPF